MKLPAAKPAWNALTGIQLFNKLQLGKGISVILCCYNSAQRLPETLRHLALQMLPDEIPWELIVVDNASSDNTRETVFTEWQKFNLPVEIRVVEEKEQGVVFARKRGISIARYEYLLFCDDDNWLRNDYMDKAFQIMEKLPDAGAIGGQSDVSTDGILPEWWEENKNSYAVGKQSLESGDITSRGYLWGAGLISRKTILDKVFDSRYPFILRGRTENTVSSGDDSEICSRIILLGWKLYFYEDLIFTHFIPKERLTNNYLFQLISGFESIYRIQNKYKLAVKLSDYSLFRRILGLTKKIVGWIYSGFDKQKAELLKGYLLFAFGINIVKDVEYLRIYQFSRQK